MYIINKKNRLYLFVNVKETNCKDIISVIKEGILYNFIYLLLACLS